MHQHNVIANTYACTSILGACTEDHMQIGNFVVDYIYKYNVQRDTGLYTAMMSILPSISNIAFTLII